MPRSLEEVAKFMNRQRLASFVTVARSNAPHVVPVFFTYSDGKVYVQTDRASTKVRNLLKNSRVAIAVYSDEETVIIRGTGRIVDNNGEFVRRTQDHIYKYQLRLDEKGRDSLGIPLFDKKIRCVVEVTPKKILFW